MKESGLVKFKHFWKNKKGAVTIEFLFMSMFLIVLFAFLLDLVMLRSTLGKLDNASYTLVSILRERTQLYDRVAQINIDDHKQFEKLAKKLIYGDQNSNKRIDVVLEYWAQDGSGRRIPNIIGDCKPYKKLSDLSYLSPRSELNNERKIPLYQITLCVETQGLFETILLDKSERSTGLIRSSSMSVSR
ncbi:tight adherence pilus pseudopilin TadF [Pasteurella multocida]|uniref:tight adherence pilus pseudopilin TadF n=1 Tax=Pasteurella multocida TaxID=747 RepID=UPI000BBD0DCD|nr:tight adherence pilus pseudopilin TadF [Pasteurella multocida]ATF74168.1 protein TadF [Pasteurella multocida]ATN16569.1 protein TadF [Pasteurella multocida]HDR1030701.1 protein TadF [Pasteurella multocida]HDR1207623.1 protein TadF [Pasteurella multocida]HDR1385795.1 protein TadF [Pasteurella multocida]